MVAIGYVKRPGCQERLAAADQLIDSMLTLAAALDGRSGLAK
jgi:hypothetical protein